METTADLDEQIRALSSKVEEGNRRMSNVIIKREVRKEYNYSDYNRRCSCICLKVHTVHEDVLLFLITSFSISICFVLFPLLRHPSLSKIDFEVLARNQCILMLHFSNLKLSR